MLFFTRGSRFKIKSIRIVALAMIWFSCGINPTGAQSLPEILVLNSYHQGEDWSDNELSGICSSLRREYPFLVPAIEHLDTKRFPGPEHLLFLKQYLKNKYQGRRLDLVFVLDNPALDLLAGPGRDLFPGVPIVFAGINGYSPDRIRGLGPVAGVAEVQDMAGTLDLALSLHPETKSVLVIHDHTSSGLAVRKEMAAMADHFLGRATIHYTPDETVDDLVARLKSLPSDALVLLLTYVTDKAGRTLTREESTRLITDSSPVPVYAMHETRMGYGILGGMLLEGREHGEQAAKIALRILSQNDAAVYAVENSRSRPVFDYQQLVRFNVPTEHLPENSTQINQPVSFFQQHRVLLIPGFIIAVLLMTIIAILSLSVVRIRKAGSALEKSEEKYRLAMDAASDGLWDWRVQTKEVYYSPGWTKILEIPVAASGYDAWASRIFPDDLQDVLDSLMRHLEGHTDRWEKEHRLQTGGGEWKWVLGRGTIVERDPEGKPLRMVGTMTDINERKQAEKALAEALSWYRAIFDGSRDAIFISDPDMKFVSVNDAACRLTGFGKEELLTMRIPDLLAETDPDRFKKYHDMILSGEPITREARILRKDSVKVDGEFSNQKITIADQTYMHTTARDISDRKTAEGDLMESREKYRHFVETANEGVWAMDANYRTTFVNRRMTGMLGYTEAEMAGQPFESFLFEEDLRDHHEKMEKRKQGKSSTYERRFCCKDGREVWTQVSATPIMDAEGRFAGSHAFFSDISERKRVEKEKAKLEVQLQQAQKMEAIGSLAGGIAHDLNNILFPISGLSEMLLDDIPPDNPMHESMEQIHQSAQRGSDLVKQILAFSRQSNPRKLPVRIQPILKEALKLARATIPRKIEIASHINADCGMVSADPTQVHQILMNLITNACHAVEENGGGIYVVLKEAAMEKEDSLSPGMKSGRYAAIIVSDTGTGIDNTLIHKIFEPYFTTKEQGKGTGLGLSVVHGIVKEYGGDIRVTSEVGRGTAFHVYLPLLEDFRDGKTSAATRKYPTGRERILIVDDEEPIVRMGKMTLERLGYRVTARTGSLDALEVFRANPDDFDLVISDRGMPNMTGDQLAGELMAIRPKIPVILCTGFSNENDEKRARAMGVKGFLMKPVATGDLAATVREMLDKAAGSAALPSTGPAGDETPEA